MFSLQKRGGISVVRFRSTSDSLRGQQRIFQGRTLLKHPDVFENHIYKATWEAAGHAPQSLRQAVPPLLHTQGKCTTLSETHWVSMTTAELFRVMAPQSWHFLEACRTKSCKLIGMVLHSSSLCLLGKSTACDGLTTSRFLHALSCHQEGYLHIMP